MYFFSEAAAPLSVVDVVTELTTAKGLLRATTRLEVVEPLSKRAPPATTATGLPEIQWVKKESWPQEWNEKEVGDVQLSRNVVTIRLNEDYDPLQAVLSRRKGKAISSFRSRYLVSAAVGLWLQEVYVEESNAEPYGEVMRNSRQWIAAAAIEGIETSDEPIDDE